MGSYHSPDGELVIAPEEGSGVVSAEDAEGAAFQEEAKTILGKDGR